MASPTLICETQPWKTLKAHVEEIKKTHLRDLMSDSERCKSMMIEIDGLFLDYSRQCANQYTMGKLLELAEAAHLKEKINKMYSGEHINSTEDRSVLHVALRAPRDAVISSDGKNVVPEVWKVVDKIQLMLLLFVCRLCFALNKFQAPLLPTTIKFSLFYFILIFDTSL